MASVTEQYDKLRATLASSHGAAASVSELTDDLSFSVTSDVRTSSEWPKAFVDALQHMAAQFGTDPVVEISVCIPPRYPLQCPTVRLIRPVLREDDVGSAQHVLNGNLLLPALLPRGWNPSFTLSLALSFVQDFLTNSSPVVDTHAPAFYNAQAFQATHARLQSHPADRKYAHPHAFERQCTVYSTGFAADVMGLQIPAGFEAGNKVLAPVAMLERLARGETEQLVDSGDCDVFGAFRSVSGSGSFSESAAMVFELTSYLGICSYIGVQDFVVPHPDVIILPAVVMAGLGAVDGADVSLKRVKLPPIKAITLQPHSREFMSPPEEGVTSANLGGVGGTGLLPREFLEAALTRHVSLQRGDIILCDSEGGTGTASLGNRTEGPSADEQLEAAMAASIAASSGGVSAGATDDALAAMDDDVLSALLSAGVNVDELSQAAQLASSHEKMRVSSSSRPPHSTSSPLPPSSTNSSASGSGNGAGINSGSCRSTFRFTVISVDPPDAPAGALWQAFSSQIAIDILPARDEFVIPRAAAPAADTSTAISTGTAGTITSPPVGVWRPLPAEVADSASPIEGAAAGTGGGSGSAGGYRLGSGGSSRGRTSLPPLPVGHGAVAAAPSAADREDRRRRAAEAAAARLEGSAQSAQMP